MANSKYKHNAIVLGVAHNGLGVIRELAQSKVKVFGFNPIRSFGTYSRFCKYIKCPDPINRELDFFKFLIKFGKRFKHKPVIFPSSDHWVLTISKYEKELSDYFILCSSKNEIIQLLVNKDEFYKWGINNNYPVPKVFEVNNNLSIKSFSYPIIAKPKFLRMSSNDSQNKSILKKLYELRLTVLNDKNELLAYIENYKDLIDYIIFQEYVRGLSDQMYSIGVYCDKNSDVRVLFTGRKLRGFPVDYGNCMLGQSDRLPKELINISVDMMKRLGYRGIAEIEFKKDSITNEYKIIEINARTWSWTGITSHTGANIPFLAFLDLINIEIPRYSESTSTPGEVKWVRIIDDFKNCLYLNKKYGYQSWHFNFFNWIKTLKSKKIVIAEGSFLDPLPLIFLFCQEFKSFIRKRILRKV